MSNSDEKSSIPDKIDIDKLPEEVKEAVKPDGEYEVEKEAKISSDGRQFLVRFPKKVAEEYDVDAGDKVRFRVVSYPPESKKEDELEMRYVRSDE